MRNCLREVEQMYSKRGGFLSQAPTQHLAKVVQSPLDEQRRMPLSRHNRLTVKRARVLMPIISCEGSQSRSASP
eukprot:724106-Amphidinium_carterae.1